MRDDVAETGSQTIAAPTTGALTIELWHHPTCSNARGVLQRIREAGIEPTIVEYLKTPPNRARLAEVITAAGLSVREAIREKEVIYAELRLGDAGIDDDALLDAMVAHPVLINRPFVIAPAGVRLCRPPDLVLELLPRVR